jgi:hypothetical protein
MIKRILRDFSEYGQQVSTSMALVTTHWGKKDTSEYHGSLASIGGFTRNWWKDIPVNRASVFRLEPLSVDRWKDEKVVIDYLLGKPTHGRMPLLKLKVVDQKRRVMKTQAGKAVTKLIVQRMFQLKQEQQELRSSNDRSKSAFINKTEVEKMETAKELEVEIASLRSSYLKLGGSFRKIVRLYWPI